MTLEKQLLSGLIVWVGDYVIHFEDPDKYTATHKTGKSQFKMERTEENARIIVQRCEYVK